MRGTVLGSAVHTAPPEVVAPYHAGLETLKKGFEIGNARGDDAQVLHQLSAENHRPDSKRRIIRTRGPVEKGKLGSDSGYHPLKLIS